MEIQILPKPYKINNYRRLKEPENREICENTAIRGSINTTYNINIQLKTNVLNAKYLTHSPHLLFLFLTTPYFPYLQTR